MTSHHTPRRPISDRRISVLITLSEAEAEALDLIVRRRAPRTHPAAPLTKKDRRDVLLALLRREIRSSGEYQRLTETGHARVAGD